jgi:hypothetical protein
VLFSLVLFLNVSDASATADNQTNTTTQNIEEQVTSQSTQEELVSTQSTGEQVTSQSTQGTDSTQSNSTQSNSSSTSNSTTSENTTSTQSSQTTTETSNQTTTETSTVTNNVNNANSTASQVDYAAGTDTAKFTMNQVISAASWVKNYVETNHGLPNYVIIDGIYVDMPSFLKLLTNSVLQISNGTSTSNDFLVYNPAPKPRDEIQSGNMSPAEYLKIAADVKSFMDRTGVAPEYAYNTSLGLYFGYQNMVYTYAKILDSYGTNGVLPAYVSLKPWSLVTNPPVSLTIDQVISAASWVKSYVDTYHNLPDYVTIGTTNVSMPSFLELLTTTVLQINNGTNTTVTYMSFSVAPVPRDSIKSGDMAKAEYLKIASDVKSFMDSKGVAPEYAYNTSLGLYLGYQSMVYMYSTILDSYGVNKTLSAYSLNTILPNSVTVKPWSLVTNPPVSFTLDQIASAATWVKNYVETNHKLPDYVTIDTYNVGMPSFLELLTTSVLQISNGTDNTMDSVYNSVAPTPRDEIKSGDMAKAEYLKIAIDVKSFMDSRLVAPEYAYNTSLGYYLGYQNLVYMYAKVMDSYSTNGVLPTYVSLRPWKFVSDPNILNFTIDQVTSAATWVKNYVDTNHKLPDYVTIGSSNVSMYSFLELLTTSVLQINNGTGTTVDYVSFGTAPTPKDLIKSGDMAKAEYLKIAADVKSFMDSKGVAPEYAYNTSLGLYFGYQSMVYTYAKILDSYGTNGVLPAYISLKPWSLVTNPPLSFTLDQIATAATWVKNYVDTNEKLPDYVTIGSSNVTMSSFLELLTTSVLQINNGTGTTVDYVSFGVAPTPRDEIHSGDMAKAEYLKIANDVKSFMDSKGVAPEYAYNTSLGYYMGYQSLVYMYVKVLDSYKTNGVLPASVTMKPWTTFTLDQVGTAATWVTNYVQTNQKLPDYVTIGSTNVNMSSFLEILTTAALEVSNGQTTPIYFMACLAPATPKDTITSGNIYTAEYLKIASDVKSFMDSKWVAPEYVYNTSLGSYLGFQNLVYMYAMLIDYNHRTGKIAEYAAMKPWSSGIPADLIPYTQPSANCQSNNAAIIALANSLTAGANSNYEKAVNIFNWVRDNVSYAFYYDTQKGALGTLSAGSGNCCDTTHLLIALTRAAGIPAEYVHGTCAFSSGTYGHVFAKVYVDGTWYYADAISSRNYFGVINNWDTSSWTLNGIYLSLPF